MKKTRLFSFVMLAALVALVSCKKERPGDINITTFEFASKTYQILENENIDMERELTIVTTPAEAAENLDIKWSVDDDEVAFMTLGGVLMPNKAGTVVVTAEALGRKASCTVTITPIQITAITCNPTKIDPLNLFIPETFDVTVEPKGGNDANIEWAYSTDILKMKRVGEGKWSVEAIALKDGVSGGLVQIRAYFAGKQVGDINVKIFEIAVNSVQINEKGLTLGLNSKTDLTIKVLPTNASYQQIKWSSSDESVAKVDASTGHVTTFEKEGTVTITALNERSGKSDQTQITVSSKPAVTGFSLVPGYTLVAYYDDIFAINITNIQPSGADGNTINWSCSDPKFHVVSQSANGITYKVDFDENYINDKKITITASAGNCSRTTSEIGVYMRKVSMIDKMSMQNLPDQTIPEYKLYSSDGRYVTQDRLIVAGIAGYDGEKAHDTRLDIDVQEYNATTKKWVSAKNYFQIDEFYPERVSDTRRIFGWVYKRIDNVGGRFKMKVTPKHGSLTENNEIVFVINPKQ